MLKLSEKHDSQADTKILLDAISKDKVHLARFILDALDDKIVDAKSEGEHTPLISSVFLPDSQTRAKFLNLLLQRGANVNQQDACGRTALSHACEKGYLDAVKTLVRNNADPEIVDAWGNSALMYAAVAGHSLVVEFLVRAFKRLGLQIDRQNHVGNSAVKVARYLGHKECLCALISNSKKAQDQDELNERFAALHAGEDAGDLEEQDKRFGARRINRKKYPSLWSRMMSMDSIDELEKESESKERWLTAPQIISAGLTPKLSQRCRITQTLQQVAENCPQLPPLRSFSEASSSALFSPRPGRNSECTAGDLSGPLGILLTPIRNVDLDKEDAADPSFSFSARMFNESYYRKRCSLPTNALGVTPMKPSRKSKPAQKSFQSPPHLEDFPPSPFSVLSHRLLRRFTLPELKKSSNEARDAAGAHGGARGTAALGMPRSETFPLSTSHPQVGAKPSIDSISAVRCEFDFHLKSAPS